jgi:hypothetical protein
MVGSNPRNIVNTRDAHTRQTRMHLGGFRVLMTICKHFCVSHLFIIFKNSIIILLEHDENLEGKLAMFINTCIWTKLSVNWKNALLSPTLLRTHLVVVFIYRKVASWGVPQGVPRFVNGTPRMHCPEYHTRAAARPARAGLGLGLGDILIF